MTQQRDHRHAFPPDLTGGESIHRAQAQDQAGAKVDWMTCTWFPDPDEHVPATIHHLLCDLIGDVEGTQVPGMFGYDGGVRYFVRLDDGKHHHVARVDYGGNHHKGRARLDISGSACARVKSWPALAMWVEQQADYKLTRVDLAVDCLDGEWSVEHARDWLQAGEFNSGGRNPRHSCPGDWLNETPTYGRTLEVGRRENGKMLRAYEKGLQLAPASGDKWTRWEVELRNIDRDLPLDVLTHCDKYFVGAYKCLERILACAGERIATHQKEGDLSLDKLSEHLRSSYGRCVNVLRQHIPDVQDLLDFITLPGVPRRLEKATLAGFTHTGSPPAFLLLGRNP